VFRRTIAPDQIVAAIVADTRASHLCHGLTGLDDETLQFLLDHPAIIRRLYERAAAPFAASASSLRIHDDRVVVPGGAPAADVWAAALGVSPVKTEGFIRALFEEDEGRVAYLRRHCRPRRRARVRAGLRIKIGDAPQTIQGPRRAASLGHSAVAARRLLSPAATQHRLDAGAVQVRPTARRFSVLQSEWAWVFAGTEHLPLTRSSRPPPTMAFDAAGLAQLVVSSDTRERRPAGSARI
jgi:hypothetical protein